MTAGPSSPGVGAPVYHPAGKPAGGTSIVPSSCRPSSISVESTPIAGISRRTGADLPRGVAAPAASATPGDGTGGAGSDRGPAEADGTGCAVATALDA